MTQATVRPSRTRAQIADRTLRKDPWWRAPAITATLLTIWVIYATVRVFMGHWYWVPKYHYLTPFYSPCVSGECAPGSSSLGQLDPRGAADHPVRVRVAAVRARLPAQLLLLPAGVLPGVLASRRAACAVREPHASYSGETRFPLILQNLHRYFFYLAVPIAILLTYDVAQAFRGPNGDFGFGLGTLIMLVNVILIWAYTLSCHSCRHITGGRLKNFSRHPVRYWIWTQISKLNARHMQFAWLSLGTLMLADLYIWLVSAGVFSDPRIFN